MNIGNAFLVCGSETAAPTLHFLSPEQSDAFWTRRSLCLSDKGIRQAIQITFGVDGLYAMPANVPECMADLAMRYNGPDAPQVRGIAAALALGQSPFPVAPETATAAPVASASRPTGGGGIKSRRAPRSPVSPSTPGSFFWQRTPVSQSPQS